MNPTVWITGVAGFTGRHLVQFLAGLPDRPRIIGLDVAERPTGGIDGFHRVNLHDSAALAACASQNSPQYVIHLAAAMPPADAERMWDVNVVGTLNLLRALSRCRGTRVVIIGSAAEYLPKATGPMEETDPCSGASVYGQTKWAQTGLALSLGRELALQVMVARTFNIIGPGLPSRLVAGWLCEQFAPDRRGKVIEIGNIDSGRDFVDIRDAVEAYWRIATTAPAGEVYNVCTGRPATIRDLIAILCELTGTSPGIRIDPARVRAIDPTVYGSPAKLTRTTGWQPRIALKASLAAMLEAQSA